MAYDFVVGWRSRQSDASELVAAIEYREAKALAGLMQRSDSFFLARLTDLFKDQSFSSGEVGQALAQLLPLMCVDLQLDERALLHKLIAVLAFASHRQEGLHCLAD